MIDAWLFVSLWELDAFSCWATSSVCWSMHLYNFILLMRSEKLWQAWRLERKLVFVISVKSCSEVEVKPWPRVDMQFDFHMAIRHHSSWLARGLDTNTSKGKGDPQGCIKYRTITLLVCQTRFLPIYWSFPFPASCLSCRALSSQCSHWFSQQLIVSWAICT